jgi:tetratricopeptide (TPR) repeat protein
MKERPTKIEWLPQGTGIPASVIALWGKIELRQLDQNDIATLAEGDSPRRGVLVDFLGDLRRSAQAKLPVYQIVGGAGYLYSASFDKSGRGHRHYVASDASIPAIRKFEPALQKILQEDESRASDDYGLWPRVAETTRNLALDTSPSIANAALDKVFDRFSSKKLRSHVWSFLPLSSLGVGGLADYYYMDRIPIYGPKTEHPDIRLNIQKFLAEHPAEPFAEFLYYTIGEFDKALQANPKSIIGSVVAYAAGFQVLESLVEDVRKVIRRPEPDDHWANNHWEDWGVNDTLTELNEHPELYDKKILGDVVPTFARRAAIAKPYFETVLRDGTSPQQDDAAYMLGWLAFHQGKFREALEYTSQALRVGNGDYAAAATVQLARILGRLPPRERMALLEGNPVAAQGLAIPLLLQSEEFLPVQCLAVRNAYLEFNYRLTIDLGRNMLIAAKVPLDRMPVTTDRSLIREALEKLYDMSWDGSNTTPERIAQIRQNWSNVDCFTEVLDLIEASKGKLEYEEYLKTVASDRPDNVIKHVREVILEYDPKTPGTEFGHAVHAIDVTLESVPKTAEYAQLREWLYYRKIRVLVQFNPAAVRRAVSAMEGEFARSQLMQHALAEQIYAEGARLEDVEAAEITFRKLLNNFPTGSAIDNAYTWMAISYHCAGRLEDAKRIDKEIIRLFPTTRHAIYASERLSNPGGLNCKLTILWNDLWEGVTHPATK